jgi:hypothetical protein
MEIEEIANQWFNAFNAHNLKTLLSLYDDQAEHYSPKLKVRQPHTKGIIKGKEALQNWWADAFQRLPELNYEPLRLTPYANRVFMEYIRHVPGEEDLLVAELLEVKGGLIIASKVFHG